MSATIIEENLRQSAVQVMQRYNTKLADMGLSLIGPEVEVSNAQSDARTSEFRIWVYGGGDIKDILEFHVFRDGRQIVTEPELISWLDQQISEIVN